MGCRVGVFAVGLCRSLLWRLWEGGWLGWLRWCILLCASGCARSVMMVVSAPVNSQLEHTNE